MKTIEGEFNNAFTDERYQSQLPLYARNTASQAIKVFVSSKIQSEIQLIVIEKPALFWGFWKKVSYFERIPLCLLRVNFSFSGTFS